MKQEGGAGWALFCHIKQILIRVAVIMLEKFSISSEILTT